MNWPIFDTCQKSDGGWTVQFLTSVKNRTIPSCRTGWADFWPVTKIIRSTVVGLDRLIFDRCQKSDGAQWPVPSGRTGPSDFWQVSKIGRSTVTITLTITLNTNLNRLGFPFANKNYELWTGNFLTPAKNQIVGGPSDFWPVSKIGRYPVVGLDGLIFDQCQKSDGPQW